MDDIRPLLREPLPGSLFRAVELCATAGVALVVVPGLRGARVWGMTRWLSPGKALIQLSLRGKTDDQLWFTFLHQTAHILLHPKTDIFVERNETVDSREDEANRFAAEFLIPSPAWRIVTAAPRKSAKEVELLAKQIGVSSGILVGRLQKEGMLPYNFLNGLKTEIDLASAEPDPTP